MGFTYVHTYVLKTFRARTRGYGLEIDERVWLPTYVRTCVRGEEDAPGEVEISFFLFFYQIFSQESFLFGWLYALKVP